MKLSAVEKRCQFDGTYVILIKMIMIYDIIVSIGINMVGWTHTVQDCLTIMSALRSSGAYRRHHRPSMNVRECVFVSHFKLLRFFSQSFWKSSPAVVENATKLIETNPFLNSVGSNIRATALKLQSPTWTCSFEKIERFWKWSLCCDWIHIQVDMSTKVCRFLQVDMPILRYGQERLAQRLES